MTQVSLLQRIELTFWNRAIPLMSESETVRYCIRKAYDVSRREVRFGWLPALLIASATVGLSMGFLLGRLGAIAW
jgi:hypothetical protein